MEDDDATSVKNDLRKHFSVLDDLSHKFEDYTAIPTISFDR